MDSGRRRCAFARETQRRANRRTDCERPRASRPHPRRTHRRGHNFGGRAERHYMAARMNRPLYTTEILRLAAALREPQALEAEHGRAELRSPTCGSRIVTMVQLDE